MNETVITQVEAQSGALLLPIITFFTVLLGGFILTRLLTLLVKRLLKDVRIPHIDRIKALDISTKKFFIAIGSGILYVASIAAALHTVGLFFPLLIWSIRILAGVAAVGLLLYISDVLNDMRSSRKLAYEIHEGTVIKTPDFEGEVSAVRRRSICVKEEEFEDGMVLTVPKTYLARLKGF